MSFYYKRLPYDGHVLYDEKGKPTDFKVGEPNDGSSKTEQSGASSSLQQVKMFMQAGERMQSWKAGFFDYQPGEDISDSEALRDAPTRSSDYDLSDAALQTSYLSGRMAAARAAGELKRKEAEKAAFDTAVAAAAALMTEATPGVAPK